MSASPSSPGTAGAAEGVDVLILRFHATLSSFGSVAIDEKRGTDELPGRSLLTGLLANALGWHHRDGEQLNRLQSRLVYAVRQDRAGDLLEDFHTVDLGQPFLLQGWTSHGRPEGRGGGTNKSTHIRRRHFLADAAHTVALTLEPADESPDLDDLERALGRPARPLFLGRKTCLPSRPLVGHRDQVDRLRAPDPLSALARVPAWDPDPSAASTGPFRVWWPGRMAGADPEGPLPAGVRFDRSRPLYDERDWRHQLHAGRRFVHEGVLTLATSDPVQGGPNATEP